MRLSLFRRIWWDDSRSGKGKICEEWFLLGPLLELLLELVDIKVRRVKVRGQMVVVEIMVIFYMQCSHVDLCEDGNLSGFPERSESASSLLCAYRKAKRLQSKHRTCALSELDALDFWFPCEMVGRRRKEGKGTIEAPIVWTMVELYT